MINEEKNKSLPPYESHKSVVQTTYKYSELTGKIIGCAMRVHSALGNGFQEVIYQRALEIEMTDEGIAFSREHEMPIYYKHHQIGTRRVDFLVEGVVSVELKCAILNLVCLFVNLFQE